MFVADAARAIVLAAERYDGTEPVNIGAHREITIRELVLLIAELTGFTGEIRWDPTKPDGQPRRCLDTTRARELFGFAATTDFSRGAAGNDSLVSRIAKIMKLEAGVPPVFAAEQSRQTPRPTVVIQPSRGWATLNLGELWAYRDLLLILAGRDIKLRYKQTALGIIWVVLQPIVAALIFAVIFGRFAGLPSDGLPYLLFAFCGLLPWNYFSGGASAGRQ